MVKNNNYKNALIEVQAVLELLAYKDYEKIPTNIIESISKNKNSDYVYEYKEDLDFKDWILLPETKAILYNLFRDYLATTEQKKFIAKKEKVERFKLEQEKIKKYNPDNLFKKPNQEIRLEEESNTNEISMVEYKETVLRKIINKIKSIFAIN